MAHNKKPEPDEVGKKSTGIRLVKDSNERSTIKYGSRGSITTEIKTLSLPTEPLSKKSESGSVSARLPNHKEDPKSATRTKLSDVQSKSSSKTSRDKPRSSRRDSQTTIRTDSSTSLPKTKRSARKETPSDRLRRKSMGAPVAELTDLHSKQVPSKIQFPIDDSDSTDSASPKYNGRKVEKPASTEKHVHTDTNSLEPSPSVQMVSKKPTKSSPTKKLPLPLALPLISNEVQEANGHNEDPWVDTFEEKGDKASSEKSATSTTDLFGNILRGVGSRKSRSSRNDMFSPRKNSLTMPGDLVQGLTGLKKSLPKLSKDEISIILDSMIVLAEDQDKYIKALEEVKAKNMDHVVDVKETPIEGIKNFFWKNFKTKQTDSWMALLEKLPIVKLGSPLSRNEWEYSYSTDGVVTEPDKIKATIFWGGVESSIRKDVWKYLLDFYKWDSTSVSREKTRETMRDVYGELKQKWINRMKEECKLQFQQQGFDHSSIPIGFEPPTNPRQFVATVIGSASATRLDHSSPAGGISEFEKNVMTTYGFRELCQVVAHDVRRTDRESPLFKEDEGPGLTKLSNVLMTYSYNCSVVNGYAQGMNDLAATILHVIDDEAQSFWCFKGLMDKVHNQFKTMCLPHLKAVAKLVQMVDPYLCSYFEKIEASDMLFLFQSILLCFKRDFETEQVKRLWEIFWTDQLTPHFHLFFTLAVVLDSRNEILEQEMDSQDLLMYFKSMNKHNTNIEDCLVLATRLWLYFEKNATASQKNDIFEKL